MGPTWQREAGAKWAGDRWWARHGRRRGWAAHWAAHGPRFASLIVIAHVAHSNSGVSRAGTPRVGDTFPRPFFFTLSSETVPTCRYYLSRKPRPSHALTATALTDIVAPPPLPPTKGNLHRHLHLPHHKRSLTGGRRRAGRGRRSGQNVLKRRPACLTLSLLQLAYAVDMWDQL